MPKEQDYYEPGMAVALVPAAGSATGYDMKGGLVEGQLAQLGQKILDAFDVVVTPHSSP